MNIILNGESVEIASSVKSISDLMASLSLSASGRIVEYNRRILTVEEWPETTCEPDSEIEIIQFMGGG